MAAGGAAAESPSMDTDTDTDDSLGCRLKWGHRSFVLEAVEEDGSQLEHASNELRGDKAVVMEAVKQYGKALEHAHPTLQGDKDVVLEAVKQSTKAFEYAGRTLRSNKDVVLEAVKLNGSALRYADPTLQSDKDVVLEAAKQNYPAFKYADPTLRGDRDFVVKVVEQNGLALEYADPTLRSDKDVVLQAVKQNGDAFEYAARTTLRGDKDVVLEAVKQNGRSLLYADPGLRRNKDVVLEAVKRSGLALRYAGPTLRDDRDFVVKVVEQNGLALKYADPTMQSDEHVVLEAVKQNGDAFEYAGRRLRGDKHFALKAVKNGTRAFRHADAAVRDDQDFVLEAAKLDCAALHWAGDAVRRGLVGDLLGIPTAVCPPPGVGAWREAFGRRATDEELEAAKSSERKGEYALIEEVGMGVEGVVHKAVHVDTRLVFALKVFKEEENHLPDLPELMGVSDQVRRNARSSGRNSECAIPPDKLLTVSEQLRRNARSCSRSSIRCEGRLMHTLSHPERLGFVECFKCGEDECLVLQLLDTTLYEWIRNKGQADDGTLWRWAVQLFSYLTDLAADELVHCDVCPHNVLLHNGNLVLCDYGQVAKPGPDGPRGHVEYHPPSVSTTGYTPATDVYAAMATLLAAATGRRPDDWEKDAGMGEVIRGLKGVVKMKPFLLEWWEMCRKLDWRPDCLNLPSLGSAKYLLSRLQCATLRRPLGFQEHVRLTRRLVFSDGAYVERGEECVVVYTPPFSGHDSELWIEDLAGAPVARAVVLCGGRAFGVLATDINPPLPAVSPPDPCPGGTSPRAAPPGN
eukprot:Hpha_TRINITY_DN13077_c0_g1::TRINITY_DN13077_c0_g1_i3::g.68751::m.68751